MTDNQQARDFFPRVFSDSEAKIVGGLMSSNILLSRGAVTGYAPSGFVFFPFSLIVYVSGVHSSLPDSELDPSDP
jgi:hypothetical protein